MKFDLVKEELSVLLITLSEQFETMNAHKNTIPQIELDIFMKNIQELYENTIFLKKANTFLEKNESLHTEDIKENSAKKTPVQTIPAISKNQKEDSLKANEIIEFDEEKAEEGVKIEAQEIPNPVTEVPPAASFDDILDETKSKKDLFSQIKASKEIIDLNKKLAEARGNHSLAEKLQNQQIDSLKSVIGINDKFYFINELFDGDSHKYDDVIYTLNNFKKLDDAMQYYSTLKYRYNWSEESEASEKLIHMLERKFDLINA